MPRTSPHSLLQRADKSDIVDAPFPHLVIHEALPIDYYEQLSAEFPSAKIVLNGREPESNKNFRYAADDSLDDPRISPLWQEFVRHHVSGDFFREACSLFESQLCDLHPDRAFDATAGADWRTNIRFREPPADASLECQFTYGAPVEARRRSIGPHIDREVALYAGLFYLREDQDDSDGGALELYRFRDGQPQFERDSRRVPDDRVEAFCTIPYAKNTLVFFLHSPYSVHGVSPRSATPYARRHVNLVAEAQAKLFDVTPYATLPASDPSIRGPVI